MVKDIYKFTNPKITNKQKAVNIYVQHSLNKPNSLEFCIADGYTTPIDTTNDIELQKEMNVIITVLNNIFDETKPEFYIDKKYDVTNVHNKINIIVNNINKHNKYAVRQNKGSRFIDFASTPNININNKKIKRNSKTRRRTYKNNNRTQKIVSTRK